MYNVKLNDGQAFILTMMLNDAMKGASEERKAAIENILDALDKAEDEVIAESAEQWEPVE